MKLMVRASEIAKFLGTILQGPDLWVTGPCMLNAPVPERYAFIDDYRASLGANGITEFMKRNPMLLIAPEGFEIETGSVVHVIKPRLAYARVTAQFFAQPHPGIASSAVLHKCVRIGTNVRVKDYAVIGQDGFAFEPDESGAYVRIPHTGGVEIGDNVEIGACTVIARGTIGDTVIGNGVKIDDRCFIAHNVKIGQNTLVIAGAEISGSVHIGEGCWIGPNACVREGLTIGDRSLVGIGAVVVKNVPENVVVAGNPARILRKRYEGNE